MNLENITPENIENGNLTSKQLIGLINNGVDDYLVFEALNDIFINYTNNLHSLDEKRAHIISLMKAVQSMKGKYKPKKQQVKLDKPLKKYVKEPKKVINNAALESIQISI